MMCRLYDVTREGYNSWRSRGDCVRRQEDAELFVLIKQIFNRHEGNYGSPKITRELHKQGVKVGQKRVARIMRENRLKAAKCKMYRMRKLKRDKLQPSPCLIADWEPSGINQLWVGDVTYIKMPNGAWQYLCVIMDRFSRRVIAWSLSARRDAALTLATLERAVRNRGVNDELVFHTDKGIEYSASTFRRRLSLYGIRQSMNRVKQMNDNAFIESFFQDFKTERIKRRIFRSVEELRGIISEYMRYYNYERSHSSIGYVSPNDFECKIGA